MDEVSSLSGQLDQENPLWDADTLPSSWHPLANNASHYLAQWSLTLRIERVWRAPCSPLNLNTLRTFGSSLRFPKTLATCLNNYLNSEFIVILTKRSTFNMVPPPKISFWALEHPTVIYFTTKTNGYLFSSTGILSGSLMWLKPSSTLSTDLRKLKKSLKLTYPLEW